MPLPAGQTKVPEDVPSEGTVQQAALPAPMALAPGAAALLRYPA